LKRIAWRSEAARYTTIGAFFGVLFPAIAYFTLTFVSRDVYILFGLICTAPFFLGSVARLAGLRQDRLNETNRGLERLVAERTSSIQSMLDVSGQGFLSFGSDLVVNPEYSTECERIFEDTIKGRRIDELLYSDGEASSEFVRGLTLCFSGNARPEVIFDLLEHEFRIKDKVVQADFRSVTNERVMLILTDVTEERRLKERVRAEDERNERVLRAVAHKIEFGDFVRSAEEMFAHLDGTSTDPESLLRELHTFKGNAGFFGFRGTQQVVHEIEDYVAESDILGQQLKMDGKLGRVQGIFTDELEVVSGTLGSDWIHQSDAVIVPRSEYLRIQSHVSRRYPQDAALNHALEIHRKLPLAELLGRFPEMASTLALQRGKRIHPVEIVGGEAPIVPERYERLVSSFGHLVRNMVDHGIEPPAEREAAGKTPEGTIRIEIQSDKDAFAIRFSDDGRGISLDRIEKRARDLGLLGASDRPSAARLVALIFNDGFSTSTSATMVSGRGVGLAEVREAVREVGGKINVATRYGKGTTFTVTIPRRNSRSKN